MKYFIKKSALTVQYQGIKINIKSDKWISTDKGWGNGYVVLDKDHPFYNMNYDDIPVCVHGGLTFGSIIDESYIGEWSEGNITKEDIGKYLIGFDTAHYNDNLENCDEEYVKQQTTDLYIQCFLAQHEKGED